MNAGFQSLVGQSATGSTGVLLLEPRPSVKPSELSNSETRSKASRYESLTIWRGVACMMLVLYHAAFYADHTWRLGDRSSWTIGGFAISCIDRLSMGVPIFFVVSGYCIAASVDSLRRRPHSLSTYFWRRIRRIYPPLWAAYGLAIVVTAVATAAGISHAEWLQMPRIGNFTIGNWVGNLTASESWLSRLRGHQAFLLSNTWTLCYEEQFYAVTGILLAISAKRFFGAAYWITVATIALRAACSAYGIDVNGFFFDGHWIMFSAGILVYDRLHYMGVRGGRVTLGVLCAGALFGFIVRTLNRSEASRHFAEYVLAASSFSLLLIAIHRWDGKLAGHPVLAPLSWCGRISYSVFLTHYPLVVLAACLLARLGIRSDGLVFLITIPICAAMTLPVAWLFHVAVERHFLNAPLRSKAG